MANFDTAAKRLSGMEWGNAWGSVPLPDGGFEWEDKQQLLDLYGGVRLAGFPVAPVGTMLLMGVGR